MAISKEDILEAVGQMSVMDLNDLVKAFEEKFGVSLWGTSSNFSGDALAVHHLDEICNEMPADAVSHLYMNFWSLPLRARRARFVGRRLLEFARPNV